MKRRIKGTYQDRAVQEGTREFLPVIEILSFSPEASKIWEWSYLRLVLGQAA